MVTEKRLIKIPADGIIRVPIMQGDSTVGERRIDLSDIPIVDAVEVVHGQWEHTHGGGYFKVTCTACGVAVMKGSTELFGIPTVKWNYCPNCGAKMN